MTSSAMRAVSWAGQQRVDLPATDHGLKQRVSVFPDGSSSVARR
jgi:hypothetical protein